MIPSTERFADYFGLQLRLAAVMADARSLPLREAIDLYTNLRRRFGLNDADDAKRMVIEGIERAKAAGRA